MLRSNDGAMSKRRVDSPMPCSWIELKEVTAKNKGDMASFIQSIAVVCQENTSKIVSSVVDAVWSIPYLTSVQLMEPSAGCKHHWSTMCYSNTSSYSSSGAGAPSVNKRENAVVSKQKATIPGPTDK